MKWHVYDLIPIDFGWQHSKTVREALAEIAESQEEFDHPDGLNTKGAKAFLEAWESAKAAATVKGWEGDFRQDPIVFWLPSGHGFDYGFAFKQDNNGTTFVVSPHALPWLDQFT